MLCCVVAHQSEHGWEMVGGADLIAGRDACVSDHLIVYYKHQSHELETSRDTSLTNVYRRNLSVITLQIPNGSSHSLVGWEVLSPFRI